MKSKNLFNAQNQIRTVVFLNLLIGAAFAAVAVIAVVLMNRQMRQHALAEAETKARMLLDRNLATHTYFSHNLKPNLFELSDPFLPEGYFDPTWMSSTYAVREIDKYFRTLSPTEHYYKEAAIDARSPENEADAYERAFIQELAADPGLVDRSAIRNLDGRPYFVTLRRGEVMEESCLRCHSTPDQAPADMVQEYGAERSFDRSAGDLVSAISIRIPLEAAYQEVAKFSWRASGLILVLLGCLFSAQFWLTRRLVLGPVARIRDKANQIADGSENLGEQIPLPAGKELRELTAAFNTMSLNLRHSVDQLEGRVQERTTEMEAANARLLSEISERKQATRALQESERKFRSLVEQSQDGIALTDELGTIIEWNAAMERILGLQAEDVLGAPLWDVQFQLRREEARSPETYEQIRTMVSAVLESGDIPWLGEAHDREIRRPDGTRRFVQEMVFTIRTDRGFMLSSIIRDITENKRIEEELIRQRQHLEEMVQERTAALAEKTILLKEIHHRVKNNLQVVSSLLDMQAEHSEDERAIQALRESQTRVRAMSVVHERLYQSPELVSFDASGYVQSIVNHLFGVYSDPTRAIVLDVQVDEISLDISKAIPCALIINELVSNALKYAYPRREEQGKISVELRSTGDSSLTLSVSDNGVGLPPDLDLQDPPSLGLQLVTMLTQQIGGQLELDTSAGTEFKINFTAPAPDAPEGTRR
jgi:PAS domain S-box-containing protein